MECSRKQREKKQKQKNPKQISVFSFSSRWHCSAWKGPYPPHLSLSSLPKVALEIVPIFARMLTIWSYAGRHQAERLLHRTSIALSLAQRLFKSDRSFPSVQKSLHGYQYKNKISPAQWGSCAGLEMLISIPKSNLTEKQTNKQTNICKTAHAALLIVGDSGLYVNLNHHYKRKVTDHY